MDDSLNQPISELINVETFMRESGYSYDTAERTFFPLSDNNHDPVSIARLIGKANALRKGKITVADIMGQYEHGKPALTRSYLAGIPLRQLAADMVQMHAAFPFTYPDYPIMPVVYALNMASWGANSYFSAEHTAQGPLDLLTIGSCMGHAKAMSAEWYYSEDHDSPSEVESPSDRYVVRLEFHGELLLAQLPFGNPHARAWRVMNNLIGKRSQFTKEGFHVDEDIGAGTLRLAIEPDWEALKSSYPVVVGRDQVEATARPIVDAIEHTWGKLIDRVNESTRSLGRFDLEIDRSLTEAIRTYAAEGRYTLSARPLSKQL